jgi:hypothetical protein
MIGIALPLLRKVFCMSRFTFNTTALCLMISWQFPAFAQLDTTGQAMVKFIDDINGAAEELH